jgi:hypothetical protein
VNGDCLLPPCASGDRSGRITDPRPKFLLSPQGLSETESASIKEESMRAGHTRGLTLSLLWACPLIHLLAGCGSSGGGNTTTSPSTTSSSGTNAPTPGNWLGTISSIENLTQQAAMAVVVKGQQVTGACGSLYLVNTWVHFDAAPNSPATIESDGSFSIEIVGKRSGAVIYSTTLKGRFTSPTSAGGSILQFTYLHPDVGALVNFRIASWSASPGGAGCGS